MAARAAMRMPDIHVHYGNADSSSEDSSEELSLQAHEMQTAQLSAGPVFNTVLEESLLPDVQEERSDGSSLVEWKKRRGPRCTPEVKALTISFLLFGLITVVQVFAAQIAHSRALLMDCISMGVDSLTYLGNIVVECRRRDGREHAISQLIIVAISLSLLCYFTSDAMQESWETVLVCQGKASADGDEEVNGWITLGFALGGVAFDVMCLIQFYKSNKRTGSGRSVNIFSAFLHVSADFLRSSATLVMSLIILFGQVDSTCIDAYSSIFIGVTIVVGAFVGFFKWLKLLASLCCCKDDL
ncbi:unnamed protein product [Durusdinium trenchii]|uniref:Cation efflux protein transmembrane domain-containing protein n=1 Tax=Durusdinium trenchii TaxID=1381693 RepID=A0ABP0HNC5_9DINO